MKTPRCRKCGRKLTSPASIAAGIGPECSGQKATVRRTVKTHHKQASGHAYNAAPGTSVGSLVWSGTEFEYKGKPVPDSYLKRYFPKLYNQLHPTEP